MGFLNDNFISSFFITVIAFFAHTTGDYLFAVMLFTVVIKLVLLPLDIKQRNSMRRMQSLQGKIQEIQERYKHDQNQVAIKTRELYKKENVSMTAGCLPMLLQLPIMFAMFGAIRMLSNIETVNFVADLASGAKNELPSALWVHNIWQPDTGTASVMPNLSEFANIFGLCEKRLDANVLSQVTTLLDNSSISQVAQTTAVLPEATFFGSALKTAIDTVSPDAVQAAMDLNYDKVVGPLLTQWEGYANGFYIFPILSGLTMLGSSLVTQKLNGSQQQAAGQNNTMMLIMMPLMGVWMAASTAVPFSVYWITSSLFTMASQVIMSIVYKRKAGNEVAKK